MATNNIYKKVHEIVTEKVNALETQVSTLEEENARLKNELAIVNAKLEVYERIASISDSKITLGFGPPVTKN